MLLTVFARHRVACNLLMAMMLLAGAWALAKLNTQFFPSFELDFVTVRVSWTGATAEDVESAVTNVIEDALRDVDGLRTMTSSSSEGLASIALEYQEGTDMGVALDQVQERVALIRNLPAAAEEPEVSRVVRYEPVARLLLHGPPTRAELRPLARRVERELLDRGIARVELVGLPQQEVAIQVPSAALVELDLSLEDIARRVAAASRDIPAGRVGREDVSRQLRALAQRRSALEFEQIALIADQDGRLLRLGDVAAIERRPRAGETRVLYRGAPAVELRLSRIEGGDSLASAAILERWLAEDRPRLPQGVEVVAFDAAWELIRERIELLVKNGLGGLVLVVAVLFLFLNGRVALWVAAGIPVSFMAALAALYLLGGSINMISLFALIMALGIIVDDAIVVGEDALARFQHGAGPLEAAEGGARGMLGPVLASSLTTIASFLPLMLVGGIIGNILFDIPFVVVCVILASLVESFLVLPGHLRHAFSRIGRAARSPGRERLDRGFERFRERAFRPLLRLCVRNPAATVCAAVALLLLAVGLRAGDRVAFQFFPAPEATVLSAQASFVAGTPPARTEAFLREAERALRAAEASLGEDVVRIATITLGRITSADERSTRTGDQFGSILVELEEPDRRRTRNPAILAAWRERVVLPPGIESFTISERRAGPPGRDVDVRLTGDDPDTLKAAALELAAALDAVSGVSGVRDDMPYGQQQLVFELTAEGRALGLTVEQVGEQLRAAYDGRIAQIFQHGDDEVEVRVMLPDAERHRLASLDALNVNLPAGGSVPLLTAVTLDMRRGFDILRHTDGRLSLRVSADVDPAVNRSDAVIEALEAGVLPRLRQRYGVEHDFEGRRADQEETIADMKLGGVYALLMIYLVLAWVFSSYGWPLVVMSAIPFALVGAVAGHWLMGIDLTILSLFGLFGLSGIVVNDSIILVVFYKQLRERGVAVDEAIVEAACQRLRAVLLTSLTTIGGLLPLLFETSLQAQFLIPMAVSISFGLGFATVLVLLVVPSLLRIHERVHARLAGHGEAPAPA